MFKEVKPSCVNLTLHCTVLFRSRTISSIMIAGEKNLVITSCWSKLVFNSSFQDVRIILPEIPRLLLLHPSRSLFNSHSLFSVPTSCLRTEHLKACLLRVYRLCPAVPEVYFLALLFFFFKKECLDLQIEGTFPPQMVFLFIFRKIHHPDPWRDSW